MECMVVTIILILLVGILSAYFREKMGYYKVMLSNLEGEGMREYSIGIPDDRIVISTNGKGEFGFIAYETIGGTSLPGFISFRRIISWSKDGN